MRTYKTANKIADCIIILITGHHIGNSPNKKIGNRPTSSFNSKSLIQKFPCNFCIYYLKQRLHRFQTSINIKYKH